MHYTREPQSRAYVHRTRIWPTCTSDGCGGACRDGSGRLKRGRSRVTFADAGMQGYGMRGEDTGQALETPSSWARASTASSIGLVSLPVNVFCWLGW